MHLGNYYVTSMSFILTLKNGGTSIFLGRIMDFRYYVDECGLQDLVSTELFYTLSNHQIDNPISSKLDKVLCIMKLLKLLPFYFYKFSASLSSDHSPLSLFLLPQDIIHKRFMFRNYWSSYSNFETIFSNIWIKFIHGNLLYVFNRRLHGNKVAFKNLIRILPLEVSNSRKLNLFNKVSCLC